MLTTSSQIVLTSYGLIASCSLCCPPRGYYYAYLCWAWQSCSRASVESQILLSALSELACQQLEKVGEKGQLR